MALIPQAFCVLDPPGAADLQSVKFSDVSSSPARHDPAPHMRRLISKATLGGNFDAGHVSKSFTQPLDARAGNAD
jgi:hypothetical protein